MKKVTLIICLALITCSAFAQGLIKFANTSTTLISYNTRVFEPIRLTDPNDGTLAHTFYFALLAAPAGTTDPTSFQFTGLYATNTATAGRFQGGSLLGVTCNSVWPALTTRSFFVAGWTASYGPVWNQAWLSGIGDPRQGSFGVSQIATGTSGGVDPVTGMIVPAMPLFSGLTLVSGFGLIHIPEPGCLSLSVLGAALLLFRRRKQPVRKASRT